MTPSEFIDLLLRICPSNLIPSRIGLAVSGGVDSMALAYLVASLAALDLIRPHDIHSFTVDHLARSGSTAEAGAVAAYLNENYGFTTHLLTLTPSRLGQPTLAEIPQSRFELMARVYRYPMLSRHCLDNGIPVLLLAHHLDDQAETVLMRLVAGTGYAGAGGMMAIAKVPESRSVRGTVGGLNLLRPFLVRGGEGGKGVGKERLLATCLRAGVKWWEDETNSIRSHTRRNAIRWLLQGGSRGGGSGGGRALLPKALQKGSLVDFAWRVNERVFWENTDASEKLFVLGGATLEICTFSGKARLTLPRWSKSPPIPTPSAIFASSHSISTSASASASLSPSTRCETAALARLLYKVVELLTPNERLDTRILRKFVPALFFPESLPTQPKVFNAAGLLWTPGEIDEDTVTWTLSRQPPILSGHMADPPPEMILSGEPGEASEWTLFDGRFYLRRRWLSKGGEQEQQQIKQQEEAEEDNEDNNSPTSTHALYTAPNNRTTKLLPTLRIRFLSKSELSKIKSSLPVDCYLLTNHTTTGQNMLQPLPPQQAKILINNAIASVPGFARFTIPVAEAIGTNITTGEAGAVVGLPSLGVWTSGLFGEGPGIGEDEGAGHVGSNIDRINTNTGDSRLPSSSILPSRLPVPLTSINGLVECVLRGDGEFIGKDIKGAGLGKGWQVVWARPRHVGLESTMKRRR